MSSSSAATKKFGGPLVKGVELDAKDVTSGKWYQAEIIASEFFKIQIKYKNYNSQYNTEWISTEKELHRLEPHGTHTVVKIEEATPTETVTIVSKKNEEKQQDAAQSTRNASEYLEETDSGFIVTHAKKTSATNTVATVATVATAATAATVTNGANPQKTDLSADIIKSLEAKVANLEAKLQTALKNDVALNNKVNHLTRENEALKTKASKMGKEINSLKKMINDLKTDDWEEIN